MKFLGQKSLLAATTLAFSALLSARAENDGDVLVLGLDNFATTVDPEPLMLVEFYAPWCGHCQALGPQYSAAATTLKNESIKLAKVDCTAEEQLCGQYDVKGYPTLKVFRNGQASEYTGPRKTDGIISYMQKQSLDAVSVISAANFTDFKSKDKVVVMSFLAEGDSKNLETFSKVADKLRETFIFGHASDAEVAKTAGVTVPSLVVYRSFDEPQVIYAGSLSDAEAVEDFVKTESVPLIDEVGPENFMTYAEMGKPLAYLFVDPESKTMAADIEKLKPIAKLHKEKLNFVWIDAIKFVNHAKGLNLQKEDWPSFAIQDIEASTKFPLEDLGDDLEKSIGDFVAKYVKGEIEASIKSEPVPEQDGPVFVLVADEFEKVLLSDSKDMLVEFYAPWCGHCKKLAPTYDTLGELYSTHKDKVLIAKMDATLNDIPPSAGFQVQSFPTIKFKAAGSQDFIDYEGERTLDGFVDYINLNGANKVNVNISDAKSEEGTKEEVHTPVKHEEL
ncbi:hypothetical protein CBS101457_002347 [Exobasidium rhododendri]|nr:hypothetical protein CBS101457_002347 [Exobasidium rhododendri]